MNRPHIPAIVSAIAASTIAFLVGSRWSLAGTLAGAAIIPVVYALVSHWSAECLNHFGKWGGWRVFRRAGSDEPAESGAESGRLGVRLPADQPVVEVPTPGETTETPSSGRRSSKLQWSLALFTCLALAISVYSLVWSNPVEKTVFRERVIEKTVTVTMPDGDQVAQASSADVSTTTTSLPEDSGAAPVEPTTTTTDEVSPEAETSSTTSTTVSNDSADRDETPDTTAPVTTTVPVTTTTVPATTTKTPATTTSLP